jgi:E3 ubiquitin-protein ligase ZNF598
MNLSEATRAAVLVAEAAEVGVAVDSVDSVDSGAMIDTTSIITHCLVCYESLVETTVTMTPCHHNEICATCHLRLRHLHKDMKCPICKQPNDQIIVDYYAARVNKPRGFDDYNIWGNDLGADFVYLATVGVFVPKTYHAEYIQPLLGHACTVPNCNFTGVSGGGQEDEGAGAVACTPVNRNINNNSNAASALKALQTHLRTKHRLALCQLCMDHNRDFVSNLPRYTVNQLKQHLTKGDAQLDSRAFHGHPLCEFCRPRRFYDIAALHYHLNKDHYKCHVCEEQGLQNQFFKNYTSLERHFDAQHFLCKDVQCLQARFVVFSNELDLRHHERQVHGGTSGGSTKISLEFRVRPSASSSNNVVYDEFGNQVVPFSEADFQYNLDGQAFVPEQLPSRGGANVTSEGGETGGALLTLHPLHVQRTAELRQQAAALRREQELASGVVIDGDLAATSIAAAFPSLAETTTAVASTTEQQQQNQFRVGWTSGITTMQRVGVQRNNVGAVTAESFPTLGGSGAGGGTAASGNGAVATRKTAATAAQRSFAAMQNSANSATVTTTATTTSWVGAGGSAVAVALSGTIPGDPAFPSLGPAPSRPSSSSLSFLPSSPGGAATVARNNNSKTNLSADNFPSLGPPPASSKQKKTGSTSSGKPRQSYSAADILARRYQDEQQQQTVEPFITRKSASQYAAVPQPKPAAPPTINSEFDFPAPPTQTIPHFNAAAASASSSTVTLEEIKASLGKTKYKELKRLTADFAQGNLDATPYVDLSAALFDQGHGDVNFWKFVPCLLSSCPNQRDAQKAFAYLEQLSKLRNGALNAEQQHHHHQQQQQAAAAAGPSLKTSSASSFQRGTTGKWASVPARVVTPQPTAQFAVQRGPSVPLSYATRATVGNLPATAKGKTSNAWGSGGGSSSAGPSLLARAKASPESVAVAAAAAAMGATPAGSATKFMAKEQKLQKQQQHQEQQQQHSAAGGKKKKKGKQNNELRQLAFG